MDDLVDRLIGVRDNHAMMYGDYETVTEAAARMQALETSLAEAEATRVDKARAWDACIEARNDERAKVIAEVAAWLRGQSQAGDKALLQAAEGSQLRRDLAAGVVAINRAATALETGEWKK